MEDNFVIDDAFLKWWNQTEFKDARLDEIRMRVEKFEIRLKIAFKELNDLEEGKDKKNIEALEDYIDRLQKELDDYVSSIVKNQLARGKRAYTIKNILS